MKVENKCSSLWSIDVKSSMNTWRWMLYTQTYIYWRMLNVLKLFCCKFWSYVVSRILECSEAMLSQEWSYVVTVGNDYGCKSINATPVKMSVCVCVADVIFCVCVMCGLCAVYLVVSHAAWRCAIDADGSTYIHIWPILEISLQFEIKLYFKMLGVGGFRGSANNVLLTSGPGVFS